MFDVNKIRQDFPMLVKHPELIYFDNGATTLKPQCVIDAVTDFYTEHTSNVHRGDYAIAATNDRLYDGTRKIFARMINCRPEEIAFVHNVTAALNQIVYGLAPELNEGDVILLTKAEHASNLLPWFRLAREKNLKIEYIETDSQANISVESFRKAMNEKVKAVSIAQVTNVLGSIQPVKEIAAIAHEYGAYVVIDGADRTSVV